MDRFIRYSLEKGRRIRAVLLLDGELRQKTVTVLAADGPNVTLLLGKKEVTLPAADILSCDYARGDHGEE